MPDLAPQHRAPLGRATIGDQLRRHARTAPERLAFVSYDAAGARSETTYGELNSLANRYADLFTAHGVGRGGRVASMASNSVDVVAAYYGALKIGASFTGINALYRQAEVAHQLAHCRADIVVAEEQFGELIEAAAPESCVRLAYGERLASRLAGSPDTEPDAELDENDVAMIVYTSGTESRPKGVLIPHRNYLASTAPAYGWGVRTGPDDVWLFVMPFHTIAGLGTMTTLTLMGATLVLPAKTDPATALGMIARDRVTVIAQTPTFYIALARQPDFGPETVGQVRRCMTYGGQMTAHVIEAWARACPNIEWGTYWGQSELSQLGTVGFFRTLADIPDGDPTWIGKPVS